MKCNVGLVDRIVRVILGGAIIAAGYLYESWLGAIGIVPLATGAMSWCPLYLPLGLSTKKDEK